MVKIEKSAINLCCDTIDQKATSMKSIVELASVAVVDLCGVPPDRAYIGAEFCENLLNDHFFHGLDDIIILLSNEGYKITFVLPLLSQRRFRYITEKVLLYEDKLNEVVVNDFGTMLYMSMHLPKSCTIVAGRTLEKSIRENRFDILSLPEIKDNINDVFYPVLSDPAYICYLQQYNVKYYETDTLPFGKLSLPDQDLIGVRVHFPRIYLSSARICEFSSIGKNASDKITTSSYCSCQCNEVSFSYVQNGRQFYKQGKCIYSTQTGDLYDIIDGKFELVYSVGYGETKCI